MAYEDLPDDQKHLRNLKAASDDDFLDDDDEDLDDADEDSVGEEGEELYDEEEGAL